MSGDGRWDRWVARLQALGKAALPNVIILAVILITLALLWRIMFTSVEIGSPATQSEALASSSELLIQIVQWSLSTVLLIGGGLIGINWYRDEKRYERDRAELEDALDDIQEFRLSTEQRLWSLSYESIEVAFSEITDSMMVAPDASEKYRRLRNGYDRIRLLEHPDTLRTRILLRHGLDMIVATGDEVVVHDGADEMASERFLNAVVEQFDDLRPLVHSLRAGLRYQ